MNSDLKTDREWLETNGLGGFASSTEGDCPTRKYHGLLVTPLDGHEGRFMLLNDARLTLTGEGGFSLGSSHYPGALFPRGFESLESFTPDPFPTWIYDNGNYRIKKEVFMRQGDPGVYVAWTLLETPSHSPGDKAEGEIDLFCSFRNSHWLTKENGDISFDAAPLLQGFTISPYHGLPDLSFQFSGEFREPEEPFWDKNIEYPMERRRGFDFSEDRFVPGKITISLIKDVPLIMLASLSPLEGKVQSFLLNNYSDEIKSRKKRLRRVKTSWDRLEEQSRHFLVTNGSGQLSVVAGYPWFGEWGRDTMIALPGLLFDTNPEKGAQVLCDYAAHIDRGLIPNTLGEMQGFTSYNSLDASLLYLRAVDLLMKGGFGEKEVEREILRGELFPAVKKIIDAFLEGNVPLARITEEGLLEAGSERTQLTWMDAMVNGKPVTPRHGKAVDLNALWYGGLVLYRDLCKMFRKPFPKTAKAILEPFQETFMQTFYMHDLKCLTDTVVEKRQDGKIRPNMLFATALGLLPEAEGRETVETAKRLLLTPLGLRTLSPEDPQFAPFYEGDGEERDMVYHQGTVWPWPLGYLVESALNYAPDREGERRFWKDYLNRFLEIHLDRQGIDSISEVFDGLNPDEGKGCFAQAWSVGELLRSWRMING
ncbi:MAG: glycogen debranching enzyme family protein [Spirochaetales bacterium]|nr:glycogen debranching enzyme family protein [Spirochaetales bacterium]